MGIYNDLYIYIDLELWGFLDAKFCGHKHIVKSWRYLIRYKEYKDNNFHDQQIQVMGIFAGMEGISPTINCGHMRMGCIDHIDKCW